LAATVLEVRQTVEHEENQRADSVPSERRDIFWQSGLERHKPDTYQDRGVEHRRSHCSEQRCRQKETDWAEEMIDATHCWKERRDANCDCSVVTVEVWRKS